MKRNYIIVAARSFIRHKWNSIFNVLGLSTGIACSVYLLTMIDYELGYDRYHNDVERIYRICQRSESRGTISTFACLPHKYSDFILENYDGIEYMARYVPNRTTQVVYKDKSFLEDRHQYVEPDIFNIIKTEFLYGNKETCLDRPNTVVLSNSVYKKYFGSGDPIGELIRIDTAFFEVTGVLNDMPENTRFKLDFYESWITYISSPSNGFPRGGRYLTTFIKLKNNANLDAFNEWLDIIPGSLEDESEQVSEVKTDFFLQPLKGLHLSRNAGYIWDWEDAANPVTIYILFGTVMMILLMSGLNYINLSTAGYSVRAGEVSIRKTLGATRRQLVFQFIGESLIIVFISHIIGLFLIELFMPSLNSMTGMNLKMDYASWRTWTVIISIILVLGLGAGSYPAFYLTLFTPSKANSKNFFAISRNFGTKEMLIVFQFSLSIILIIGTSLIFRQVSFMKNRPLGISVKDKIIIELPSGRVGPENFEQVKQEFINTGYFSGASISSSVPGRSTYTWRQWPTGEENTNSHLVNCMEVDYDYFDLYGLELRGGSKFDKNLGRESNAGYLLNEEAVGVFGWSTVDEALGKTLGGRSKIRGILKDFHYKGLQKEIEPLGLFLGVGEDARYLTLQAPGSLQDGTLLLVIKDKFKELFQDKVFNYFFLQDDFNMQYMAEDKLVKLFIVFTSIAILIACVGLFGMTAFYCYQFEKQAGIRKIFGADSSTILFSLIGRFSLWVSISYVIAVPLSILGIKMWLNNFAYRTTIPVILILTAGLLTQLVTIATVMYHTLRLSSRNPADIIKYE